MRNGWLLFSGGVVIACALPEVSIVDSFDDPQAGAGAEAGGTGGGAGGTRGGSSPGAGQGGREAGASGGGGQANGSGRGGSQGSAADAGGGGDETGGDSGAAAAGGDADAGEGPRGGRAGSGTGGAAGAAASSGSAAGGASGGGNGGAAGGNGGSSGNACCPGNPPDGATCERTATCGSCYYAAANVTCSCAVDFTMPGTMTWDCQPGMPMCANLMIAQTSSGDHDHLPLVASGAMSNELLRNQINTGQPNVYELPNDGTPAHSHTLTFSEAMYSNLRSGLQVLVTSSSAADGHSHTYQLGCTP